jgi:histidine triad (HIT) family protein
VAADDCIFCRIVERTVESLIIYEDDHAVGFVPLQPAVSGHTVMAPKPHHADIYSIPANVLSALMTSCQTLATRWRQQLNVTGVNVLHASGIDADQSVFHFHVHLFPRFPDDGIEAWPALEGPRQSREEMHARFRVRP